MLRDQHLASLDTPAPGSGRVGLYSRSCSRVLALLDRIKRGLHCVTAARAGGRELIGSVARYIHPVAPAYFQEGARAPQP